MLYCITEKYFDILNHSGVDHEYERETDRWTDGLTDFLMVNAKRNYVVWPKT